MSLRSRVRSVVRRLWPPAPKPLILMYHRIADVPIDNWGLAVSPAHFEEQLQVLRRSRRPFPMGDFVRRLVAGTLPSNAVALTFDDGYVDNLTAAKPRLAAADVPATVFLAMGYLGRPEEFWWDELARLFLIEKGPKTFDVVIRGKAKSVDLGTPVRNDDGTICAVSLANRQKALTPMWQAVQLLAEDERRSFMEHLRAEFPSSDHHPDRGRPMTQEEVRALVTDSPVSIGAHTVTHPSLSKLEAETCRYEITESKSACEALLGLPVAGFTYPYGDFNTLSRDAVISAGFEYACSTEGGPAGATSDIFALPRIQVFDGDGDAFERALRSRH